LGSAGPDLGSPGRLLLARSRGLSFPPSSIADVFDDDRAGPVIAALAVLPAL
jgi:hypothetical protein